jgi:hypothetical protein
MSYDSPALLCSGIVVFILTQTSREDLKNENQLLFAQLQIIIEVYVDVCVNAGRRKIFCTWRKTKLRFLDLYTYCF